MIYKSEWYAHFEKEKLESPELDMDVIGFIGNVLFHQGEEKSDVIYNLFSAGYCYYFACMLKIAFKRGTICQAYPYSHMVWVDGENGQGIAYDISGRYTDFEWLVPIDTYGDLLRNWRHVPSEEKDILPAEAERSFVHGLLRSMYGVDYGY